MRGLIAAAMLAAALNATAQPAGQPTPAPAWRGYDEAADARADIDRALAATGGRRVLVVFGANSCGDCRVLDMAMKQGRVKALRHSDGVISARVRGTDWYDVELRVEDEKLVGDCTCPVGADGLFCKHCVATGAAWIVNEALGVDERKGAGSPEATREYLSGLGKQKLVDMLMAQAGKDSTLRQWGSPRRACTSSRARRTSPASS